MRLIYIDPVLRDQIGHPLSLASKMTAALESRGVPYVIIGNVEADAVARRSLKNFYPRLNDIISLFFGRRQIVPFPAPWRVIAAVRRLTRQLDDCFFSSNGVPLQDNDMLFFQTLYAFEFISIASFLRKHAQFISGHRIRPVIPLAYPYKRDSWFVTQVLAFLFRFGHWLLPQTLKRDLVYCTNSGLMAKDFERLLGVIVRLLPSPIFPLPHQERADRQGLDKARAPLIVSYLGPARMGKGFDLAVKAIALACQDVRLVGKVRFVVQVQRQKLVAKEEALVETYINELEAVAAHYADVTLQQGTLSEEEYYSLLFDSDIILMPYRRDVFKTTLSNIFIETIVAGKIPLVSADTGFGREMMRFGISEAVCGPEDGKKIVEALIRVIVELGKVRRALQPLVDEYRMTHSVRNLVDTLLSYA